MTDYLVCYIDTDGVNKYTACDGSKYVDENDEFDTAAYAADNGLNVSCITNVFDRNDNLISKSHDEKERFESNCLYYGFSKEDYKSPVYDHCTGETLIFAGFLPHNRKYKAMLRNTQTGRRIKATLEYVRKNMKTR